MDCIISKLCSSVLLIGQLKFLLGGGDLVLMTPLGENPQLLCVGWVEVVDAFVGKYSKATQVFVIV